MQYFLALGSALKPAPPFFFHIMSHESTQRNSVLILSVTSSEQNKVSSDTKLLSLLINTLMEKQMVFWKSMVN